MPTKRKPRASWRFELTDTFGGDANYSWVRAEEHVLPVPMSDRALVRRAKAWAGLQGVRCTVADSGTLIEVRPVGRHAPCVVLFIEYQSEVKDEREMLIGIVEELINEAPVGSPVAARARALLSSIWD